MSETVKLIIEIPKEALNLIKTFKGKFICNGYDLIQGVQNGTPLDEILDKISAEIEEKMSHYDHFENSNTANGLRMAREIVEGYKKEVRE